MDIAIVESQEPLKLVSFCIPKTPKKKPQPRLTPKFDKGKKRRQPRHLPCRGWDATAMGKAREEALSWPPQSWHPGQRSAFSNQGWAGCLAFSIIPRNTYRETVKRTKLYYWETCRQIINLLGTIEAFRSFWLLMPVTHTYIQTSFFSPSEQFSPPLHHPSISLSQTKLPLLC